MALRAAPERLPQMARIGRHVLVAGRVQGVAFRWYAHARAGELGVDGWVQNLEDGRVEALLEGEEERVEAMLRWLAHGPPAARVTGCQVSERAPGGLVGFEIRRSGRGA